MSLRLSTALPRACSGLMYAAVPSIMPTPVIIAGDVIVGDAVASMRPPLAGSSAFANPKSSTFTVPSGRTLIFAGFRSRWMMPCSWAASSASAICFAMGSASSTGIGPSRDAICERRPLDQFHHESRHAVRPLQARRWRRCSDDSARRALRLRAESERVARDPPRTIRAGP